MKNYPLYEEGYKLADNEYMLKVNCGTGFITKFNQNGSMPKAFDTWGEGWKSEVKLTTYLFEETYRKGWKINDWRFGMSQNWAEVMHPEGFTLEIYLDQLFRNCQNFNYHKW